MEKEIAVSPVNMGVTAVFPSVMDYSILSPAFAFFLDSFHLAFCYELTVCPKTAGFMKVIRDPFPPVQRDESLFLYLSEVHCLQGAQQFLTGVF